MESPPIEFTSYLLRSPRADDQLFTASAIPQMITKGNFFFYFLNICFRPRFMAELTDRWRPPSLWIMNESNLIKTLFIIECAHNSPLIVQACGYGYATYPQTDKYVKN